MADENDNSLYMAGGNKIFNQMKRLTAKQDKVANQQQQIIDEELREYLPLRLDKTFVIKTKHKR